MPVPKHVSQCIACVSPSQPPTAIDRECFMAFFVFPPRTMLAPPPRHLPPVYVFLSILLSLASPPKHGRRIFDTYLVVLSAGKTVKYPSPPPAPPPCPTTHGSTHRPTHPPPCTTGRTRAFADVSCFAAQKKASNQKNGGTTKIVENYKRKAS